MTHPHKRPVANDLPELDAANRDGGGHGEPSWFFHDNAGAGQEELAERYRRLRPGNASGYPAQGYGEFISTRRMDDGGAAPLPYERRANDAGRRFSAPPQRGGMSHAKTYVLAALAAAVTGAGVGYGASQFDHVKTALTQLVAEPAAAQPSLAVVAATPSAPSQTTTLIAKKRLATAKLDVADVTGGLNTYIPLALHAEPGLENQDLFLKIRGLPDSAYLTAGKKDAESDWRLSLADLNNLKLVVRAASKPNFDVAVAAFETGSGELAAPVKKMTVALNSLSPVIVPVAAPPETVVLKPAAAGETSRASAIPLPVDAAAIVLPQSVEAVALLAKGDLLFQSGDLMSARQFYEQAYAKGSADGAYGIGRTYDPGVFAEFKVQGLKADPALAMQWYQKAAKAGSAEAAKRLAMANR